MTAPDGPLSRRLLVVTGKGGVGKTTVAAALGLLAARSGRRTIVAEVARRSDVASAFAAPDAGTFVERELSPGLFHVSIDPQDALEEYLRDQLPMGALADALGRSRMFGLLAAATPGLHELLTMGKLWELAQTHRRTPRAQPYDLVIADAPSTGHSLAILTAPRTFARAAGTGPIARQGQAIHETIADPARTGILAVTRAEEMPVSETGALREALTSDLGRDIEWVVANALEPDRFTPAEATRLKALAGHPAVDRALSSHARALGQRAQLARLHRLTERTPVHLLHHPGDPDIEKLADELEGQLPVTEHR